VFRHISFKPRLIGKVTMTHVVKWFWIALVFGMVLALVIPAILASHNAELTMRCRNNLKQVMLGLHNYNIAYGQLPSVSIVDERGVALHSWRPAITPYLAALPFVYKWDEPWDGHLNKRLLTGEIIHIEPPDTKGRYKGLPWHGPIDYALPFRCPGGRHQSSFYGDYFAVVGDECIWTGDGKCRLEDASDGLANTIVVVESVTVNAYWSEPTDLEFSKMSLIVNDLSKPSISSKHANGPVVAFCDGEVCQLNPKTPASVIRALLTAHGGEDVTREKSLQAGWLH
jgi:hypothetical protein